MDDFNSGNPCLIRMASDLRENDVIAQTPSKPTHREAPPPRPKPNPTAIALQTKPVSQPNIIQF